MGICSKKPAGETRRAFFVPAVLPQRRRLPPPAGEPSTPYQLPPHLVAQGAGHALGGGLHHAVVLATARAGATEQDAVEGIEQTAFPLDGCSLPCSLVGSPCPH